MEPTHLLVVYFLAALSASVLLAQGKDEAGGVTEDTITEDQRKVHQECRNPDYKQYVKCLMRPKRHHHGGDRGDMPETDLCWDTCMTKCDRHLDDCEKKCSHCTKRIRYRHQYITEYERECEVGGKCVPVNDKLGRTTNITTNIGIKNVINTYEQYDGNETTPGPGPGPGPWPTGRPPRPPWPFPALPIVPQISLVPQITYGVGYGAAGGCAYNQWLCIQQTNVQIPKKPDCSGCGSPVLHYACDVKCYEIRANTTTKPATPCKTPGCVGGSK